MSSNGKAARPQPPSPERGARGRGGDPDGPAGRGNHPGPRPIDVAQVFDGKNLLLIGATGFVGKVALSMLLRRYPNIGRVYVLVRPGAGATPEDRFFDKIARSPVFDPVREMWRDGYQSFLREKVVPIDGDVGRPLCNFGPAHFERFAHDGGLDAIVNSAGLVTFTPSLESAIRINTLGALHALEVARKTGASLVHISTCYVAGRRDGEVWEDEPVVGYFPRRGELLDQDFDAAAELADCQRVIDEVKNRASDRVHISEFREKAATSLTAQGRDPDDEATLRLAVARERKLWIHAQLTRVGIERAEHWGWTNTYTYTKSLGEQLVLAANDVKVTVVRPAVVESAVKYPIPGWNEGFNTTAPLVYLMLKGHRQIVTGLDTPLDIIPVDHVAAGMLMATAAVMVGAHHPVYQCGSSGVNPVTSKRITELTGLVIRRHRRRLADDGEKPFENRLRARLEGMPVRAERFQRTSAPQFKRLADFLSRQIDERVPRWGAPRLNAIAERVKDELATVSEFTGRVSELMDLFQPFTHDCDIKFRSDNVTALHRSLAPHDREALSWDPQSIDWRAYWMETHFEGLKKWVFPVLDDEFGKRPRTVYTYKDLLELFDATTKLHRHRVAMRLLPASEEAEATVYTYERVQDMAEQAAGSLRERGVQPEDRVMLMSENRPEWGITYFGILKAGATSVPLEHQLSLDEVTSIGAASGAVALIASDEVLERLGGSAAVTAAVKTRVLRFDEVLTEPAVSPAAIVPARKGDAVASIIYTSGTTGTPKGVMLSHKNLTSMVAKMSSIFHMYRHDGLLSVLPLHHTFEFSAGLLMPMVHGSQVTYLEEVSADTLARALKEGNITGMVGVPALWQLLHRKITKRVSERGVLVERAFEAVVDFNRKLRERMPYGIDLGKIFFFPVHRELGGRLRLLISGGSALPPDTMKAFLGLGFKLFEGYGMTEASPVLTTQRPGEKTVIGSVGRALPGVDVKIAEPDEHGVGEVVAKGPNVMLGYYKNAEATGQVLKSGWLHTGDLGRVDESGHLYIVGRKKEMILGASGENVYPDELEELYRDSPFIKEVSVVGLKGGKSGETVAALVVPDYEADAAAGVDREAVRERVREHMRQVSHKLPLYKRVRVFHLWDHDLPKTSTKKVKRREVVVELERLERAAQAATRAVQPTSTATLTSSWLKDVVAQVCQKPAAQVTLEARLADLGFDSLMFTELGVALEAAGVTLPDPGELAALETVADLIALAERHIAQQARAERQRPPARERRVDVAREEERLDDDEIRVPKPLVGIGRRALRFGQRALYERILDTEVTGRAFVPPFGGYIVAANHSSHLDMGLVKHALGESGPALVALAAKDYFFEDPVRRMYFENFTNLVPMERHGSLRESLRLASEVLRDGYILLIFPEGTRSDTGVMIDFKPSLGYLALSNRCGILPMYLAGTHDAMPKGAFLPSRGAKVGARIGPYLDFDRLRALTEGAGKAESYRRVSTQVERIVRKLCPEEHAWTLGESGRAPAAVQPAEQSRQVEARP